MTLTLNEEQITNLQNWANELPTKYGYSFIQYIGKLIEEQKVEEIKENE